MDMENLYVAETLDYAATEPPPPADADYEERAERSAHYVAWFIARTGGTTRLPPDVRPTHRYEVEFNACVLDPPAYLRDTAEELPVRKRALH